MQTRIQSAIEACANVVVGYLVALASQLLVFPLFSLVRSYVLRRWFNGLKFRRTA
jgi:membrane protein implicated in regulation of membrane protease activity